MAKWTTLSNAIREVIYSNSSREITGQVLQNALLNIISNLGNFASFAGVATPSTNPGTPDGPVYYFATQAGTYTNFGLLTLDGSCYVLYWNGTAWSSTKIGLPTTAEVTSAVNALIATETTARQQADGTLQSAIAAEAARAAGKENDLQETLNNIVAGGGSATTAGNVTLSAIDGLSAANIQQAVEELNDKTILAPNSEGNLMTNIGVSNRMGGTMAKTAEGYLVEGTLTTYGFIEVYLFRTLKAGKTYYIDITARAQGSYYAEQYGTYEAFTNRLRLYKKDGTYVETSAATRRPGSKADEYQRYTWPFTPVEDTFVLKVQFKWNRWNSEVTNYLYFKDFSVRVDDRGYTTPTTTTLLAYKENGHTLPTAGGYCYGMEQIDSDTALTVTESTEFKSCKFIKSLTVQDSCVTVIFRDCQFLSSVKVNLNLSADNVIFEHCKITNASLTIKSKRFVLKDSTLDNTSIHITAKGTQYGVIPTQEGQDFSHSCDVLIQGNTINMGAINASNTEAIHIVWIGRNGRCTIADNTFMRIPYAEGATTSDVIDGYTSDNITIRDNLFYSAFNSDNQESRALINLKAHGYRPPSESAPQSENWRYLDAYDTARYNAHVVNNTVVLDGSEYINLCEFHATKSTVTPKVIPERAGLVCTGNTIYSSSLRTGHTAILSCIGKCTNVIVANNSIYADGNSPCYCAGFAQLEETETIYFKNIVIKDNVIQTKVAAKVIGTFVEPSAQDTFIVTSGNVISGATAEFGTTATSYLLDNNNYYRQ